MHEDKDVSPVLDKVCLGSLVDKKEVQQVVRCIGLEFKGEVCSNDTDLEFFTLVEAVGVIVDTDILHTDPLGSLLHFLFSSQHPPTPSSIRSCIWWLVPVESCP